MNELYLQNLTALNMDILEVDDIVLGDEWVQDGMKSPYTRIYIPLEGEGAISSEIENHVMTPGHIYVIPAGTPLYFRCKVGFRKIYFHITLRQNSGSDIFDGMNKLFCFDDEGIAERIRKCFPIDSVVKVMDIKSYIFSIISRCFSITKDPEIGKYSEITREIMKYVERHLSSSLTVEKIANALFISPPKIRRIFHDDTGLSIGKYIDECILLAAEKEVRTTNASIHEISVHYGFCDQFYFSRCFAKKFGMSPQQYRKAHRNNGYYL